MTQSVDIVVVELMASRLCHELVGSAGAVGNGIELIRESGGDPNAGPEAAEMAEEALTLVDQSAQQVINRLKFYRLAYGFAGRTITNLAELRGIAQAYVGEGRISLAWPMPPVLPDIRDGDGKLILNLIATAVEGLPRGGEVHVDMMDEDIRIIMTGEDCMVHQELRDAMSVDVDVSNLTPRTVHGFWCALLAQSSGREIHIESNQPGEIELVGRIKM